MEESDLWAEKRGVTFDDHKDKAEEGEQDLTGVE
jgi:hypothetical protein